MTEPAGMSPVASANRRVLTLVERLALEGTVVEVGGDGTFAAELRAAGRDHVDVPLDRTAHSAGGLAEAARKALAGGRAGVVVARDSIGWLGAPDVAMAALAGLAADLGDVPLIVTTPNVAHLDVALRLLLGRWDPGADDRFAASGETLYDHVRLSSAAERAGLVEVDADDQVLQSTASTLGLDHPATSPATTLYEFLDTVRSGADGHARTFRFVRAFRRSVVAHDAPQSPDRVAPGTVAPLFTVVVRTLGNRSSLHDTLTSLAAQHDIDFEVVLTVHRKAEEDAAGVVASVRDTVDAYATAFASRVRIEEVVGGGRSAPLNRAIDVGRGRYLVILDDDDVVTADWIEQFRRAHLRAPGRVLRTLSVAQAHRRVVDGLADYEPIGGFDTPFARPFDLLEHRYYNQSPPCSFAVPIAGLRALGLRFDDDLEVCEDWDLLLAAASLLGVSNLEVYTSVYRRFDDDWSASGGIASEVWDDAVREVRERHDRTPTLVPAGSIGPLVYLRDLLNHLADAYPNVVAQVEAIERSRYWRLTAPLRWLTSKRPS